LHLKSLTLKGFKSFAQTTTLNFEPGVTAVVGPNGSGKSNVVDALAWVMGEQGVKSLRGAKMEDVIFAGTSTQAPLGRASVELVIDNADGALPIDYSEVSISRTLFRNGTSEYAINGDQCRLLDVQELLSDSGLGREMHVIVGQGQLDSILRADPLERRGLIEEAAGVLKYRRRKERSERKLEAMQGNLQRLNDLISEVGRQLKPLAKQAEVAKRAKDIGERLATVRSKLYSMQLRELDSRLQQMNASESEKRAEREILNQQLESTAGYIKELEQSLLAGDGTEAKELVYRLEGLARRAESTKSLLEQKIQSLQNEADLDIDTAPLNQQLQELEAEIETQKNLSLSVEAELQKLADSREQVLDQIGKAQAEFQQLAEQVESRRAEISSFDSESGILESKLQAKQEQLSSGLQEIENTDKRLAELRAEFESMTDTLGVGDEQTLKNAYQEAQQKKGDAQKALTDKQSEQQEIATELEATQARLSALRLGLEQTDGSKELARQSSENLSGFLADHLKIDAGYQSAVAAALGEISDALVAPSMKQAIKAANTLGEQQLGQALIVVVDQLSKIRGRGEIGNFQPIGNFFDGPKAIHEFLEGIVLADSMEQAEGALENDDIKAVVTKNGELIKRNQLRAGKQSGSSKVELSTEAELAESRIEILRKNLGELTEQIAQLEANYSVAESAEKQSLESLRALDAELAKHAEKSGRLRAQIEANENSLSQLRDQRLELEKQISELTEQLTDRASLRPQELSAPEKPEQLERLESELNALRTEEFEKRVELGSSKERISQLSARTAQLRGEIAQAEQKAQEAQKRKAQRVNQLSASQFQLEQLPKLQSLIAESLQKAKEKAESYSAERNSLTEKLTHYRTQAEEIRNKLASSQAEVQSSEMRKHELSLSKNSLLEKISDELSISSEQLLAENWESDEPEESLKQQLRQAKIDFAQLGQFNPMALEQLESLQQRHEYLKEQLADVEAARKDLRGIITTLDEQVREIFEAAFEDTKKAFGEIFPILFPGGTGSMELTRAEDSLEAGVEVSVRPAGKKIDKLSLLSGGERSLAAVAMLMAIFIARPSPFYVLDEVEAALDDANLGRLLEVLENLRESSQLVVITHQKRTMEIADVLYGVSMKQDGITKVVSQKLEKHG
jgi:chromosome segregation protein